MAKKWPGMVVQRTIIKGHSFVYRLYFFYHFEGMRGEKQQQIFRTLDHGQDLMKDTGDIQDQEEENQIGGQDPEIHWTRGQG